MKEKFPCVCVCVFPCTFVLFTKPLQLMFQAKRQVKFSKITELRISPQDGTL